MRLTGKMGLALKYEIKIYVFIHNSRVVTALTNDGMLSGNEL